MILIYFILQIILYLATISNTIYGGDSGDLVSAVITKGIPHPPGYPLYTIVGIIANRLALPLTAAGKVTLVSVLGHFATSIIIYLIIKDFFEPKKSSSWLILIATAVVSFNYVIWLYTVVAEVFALNSLIVCCLYYFGLKFYKTSKNIYLYLICFFTGLGLAHHHTFVLIMPSIIYLLYCKRQKIKFSFKFILFFVLGLLPYLYIPWAFRHSPEIAWMEPTLKGFFELVTRKIYGTFVPGSFISNSLPHRLIQIINLFIFLFNDYKIPGLVFIGLGFYSLYKSSYIDKKIKISLILVLLLFGPLFVFYANFPLSIEFSFATFERFLIVFYFLLSPIIYLGLSFFIGLTMILFKKIIKSKFLLRYISITLSIVISIYPIGLIIRNYKNISALKNDRTAENLGYDILNNVVPPAIILISEDTATFDSQYVYYYGKYSQKQIILISTGFLNSRYHIDVLKKKYPSLIFTVSKNVCTLESFIKNNSKKFNIYSYHSYKSKDINKFTWIPNGLVFKLNDNKTDFNQNIKKIDSFWKKSLNKDLYSKMTNTYKFNNLFLNDIRRIYSTAYQNTAYYLLQNNEFDSAYQHITESINLLPEDLDNNYLLSLYFGKKRQCDQAKSSIEKALVKSNDPLYLDQIKNICSNCYENKTDKTKCFQKVDKYVSGQKTSLNAL